MTYNIYLVGDKIERVKATQVGVTPSGALMLGNRPDGFDIMYASGQWLKVEVSSIQNVN